MTMTSLFGPRTRTVGGSAAGAPFTTKPGAGVPTTPTSTGTSRTMHVLPRRGRWPGGSICSTLSPAAPGSSTGSKVTRVSVPPRRSSCTLAMSSACRSSSVDSRAADGRRGSSRGWRSSARGWASPAASARRRSRSIERCASCDAVHDRVERPARTRSDRSFRFRFSVSAERSWLSSSVHRLSSSASAVGGRRRRPRRATGVSMGFAGAMGRVDGLAGCRLALGRRLAAAAGGQDAARRRSRSPARREGARRRGRPCARRQASRGSCRCRSA